MSYAVLVSLTTCLVKRRILVVPILLDIKKTLETGYVESQLRAHCHRVGIMNPIRCRSSSTCRDIDTSQQAEGYKDSGVLVCYMIERLASGSVIEKGEWPIELTGKYRARMAAAFNDAISSISSE